MPDSCRWKWDSDHVGWSRWGTGGIGKSFLQSPHTPPFSMTHQEKGVNQKGAQRSEQTTDETPTPQACVHSFLHHHTHPCVINPLIWFKIKKDRIRMHAVIWNVIVKFCKGGSIMCLKGKNECLIHSFVTGYDHYFLAHKLRTPKPLHSDLSQ